MVIAMVIYSSKSRTVTPDNDLFMIQLLTQNSRVCVSRGPSYGSGEYKDILIDHIMDASHRAK